MAIIGRSEILYETAELLKQQGHEIGLIITAKEAPEYSKSSDDFKKLAEAWKVPFLHTPKITEAIKLIESSVKIDLGVSLNYIRVIPKNVTGLFPLGILNAHGGDLPRYRGNACQAWAILNGEERVGLCIHRMIGGEIDSGDIIARDFYPVDLNTKITKVHRWFGKRVATLYVEALQRLDQNPEYILEVQSTNPNDALRCYPRKPEDGRIDWSKSAVEILRLINACNRPYAGAFCEFESQKLIIWDAETAPTEKFLAIPGQVTAIMPFFIDVATGNGKLRVKEAEYRGEVVLPNRIIKSIRSRLK